MEPVRNRLRLAVKTAGVTGSIHRQATIVNYQLEADLRRSPRSPNRKHKSTCCGGGNGESTTIAPTLNNTAVSTSDRVHADCSKSKVPSVDETNTDEREIRGRVVEKSSLNGKVYIPSILILSRLMSNMCIFDKTK